MKPPRSSSPAEAPILPWYRECWPWLLFGGPGVVVIASLASAWIAVKSDDGVVAEDYYKRGLLINRKLASLPIDGNRQRTATLVRVADGGLSVRLDGFAAAPQSLRLEIAVPGLGKPDQFITLNRESDSLWRGRLVAIWTGRQIIRLRADDWDFPITTAVGSWNELWLGAPSRHL